MPDPENCKRGWTATLHPSDPQNWDLRLHSKRRLTSTLFRVVNGFVKVRNESTWIQCELKMVQTCMYIRYKRPVVRWQLSCLTWHPFSSLPWSGFQYGRGTDWNLRLYRFINSAVCAALAKVWSLGGSCEGSTRSAFSKLVWAIASQDGNLLVPCHVHLL